MEVEEWSSKASEVSAVAADDEDGVPLAIDQTDRTSLNLKVEVLKADENTFNLGSSDDPVKSVQTAEFISYETGYFMS